jgi:selenocysteine-specific elongation factor
MRVVATAGHVDHGKSTLVQALTGTDPDRFPEEKARGLTIDLGFAFTTLPSGREIGFVDVPGHARFVKNMLAGVGAVDVAMLVVAANEGWMPQSEEHLRILDLLGVRHGVVAVTKADLVEEDARELARLEVEEHLADTTMGAVEIVTCDGRSGRGLDDLRTALDRAIGGAPAARDDERPRLWVDRVFAARGAGTVVTGTLTGGTLAVDGTVIAGHHPVRIRAIEQHGHPVARAAPGERVALNLVGVDRHDLTRGDAVVGADQWRAVQVLDAALTVLPGATIRDRARLSAAVGSGEQKVWCRRLDDGHVRVRLERPRPLAPGDRIVLRDPGADTTVAGLEVLDVAPTRRAADAPARLALDLGGRILDGRWVPRAGLDALTGRRPAEAVDVVRTAGGEELGDWLVARPVLEQTAAGLEAIVTVFHREHPEAEGLPLDAAARALRLDVARVEALATRDDTLAVEHGRVRAAARAGSSATSDAGRALLVALAADPLAPPPPDDVGLARALEREGALVETGGIWFTADAMLDARERIVAALSERGSLTIADARDVLGSTRKYVVPIMNHLDATGVTRRRGDDRVPGPRAGIEAR